MMMFWKKKNETGLHLKYIDLLTEINILKSQFKQLDLEQTTLENFVKEKIRKVYKRNDESEETQDINNSVLLPDHGFNKFDKKSRF